METIIKSKKETAKFMSELILALAACIAAIVAMPEALWVKCFFGGAGIVIVVAFIAATLNYIAYNKASKNQFDEALAFIIFWTVFKPNKYVIQKITDAKAEYLSKGGENG